MKEIIHSKIKQFWNNEKKRIQYGKIIQTQSFCRPGDVFDMIEAKVPSRRGKEFKIQQVSVCSHTETSTVEELQASGTLNFPDVNINDLGLFSSLKYHVSKICAELS
ncbi:MAG: hypothetical protein EBU33_05775 [Sphingobacteriia bacterium]|nr:hypothetical protein [Sphingobacteriia bacterium]